MGTRHIIKVRKNGKDWISQYGQWDGYPTGQGIEVMEFVRNDGYLRWLEDRIDSGLIVPITPDKMQGMIDRLLAFAEGDDDMTSVIDQMFATSVFCRDAGAKSLTMFAKRFARSVAVIDEPSGWEEYMYTIDYDNRTVTIQELYENPHEPKVYTFDEIQSWDCTGADVEMEKLEREWKEE